MQTAKESRSDTVERKKQKRPIVDCDIHHFTGLNLIKPYMPREYRELVETYGTAMPGSMHFNGGVGGRMVDSFPPEGGPAGSSLAYMQKHLLDPYNIKYGILTGESLGVQATINFDYAAAYCSAVNEYTYEHWLANDKRLKGSVLIPKQDPTSAAKEIDRIGSRPEFVQVLVHNGAMLPYGNRYYYPIYEACVRHNLPLTIHVGGEGAGMNSAATGAGHVTHYIESRAARPQVMMAHLASFIFEGVFERFPTLKVVLQEAGVFWIVPYLWRLDQDWKSLRVQTPWVRKKPSEYFRDHVRVTTQPIEATPNREVFDQMMEHIYAKDTMMFCSDYPHWDFDSPQLALPRLDDELADRVFYQNAAELYGFPSIGSAREEESE
ncbi:amidohydrolase [Paenibacillus hemerocallicola]|uniref:Amidohydrolase n=1 Tax=Paenibacillus hemerocallicola TaxID=1172614 RepID=A0A5C4TBL5_9BACL|nr:amidohydrolase family protein [Paenibacillus hemerocallicola]TNJ65990.1 amidohydrolase [Paenibacillus hemerocallicola]